MKRALPLLLIVIAIIVSLYVVFSKNGSINPGNPSRDDVYYLFYKNEKGSIKKFKLPAPYSGSVDGNLYMTGETDVIYGVEMGVSGSIILLQDRSDTAKDISEVLPDDAWFPHPEKQPTAFTYYDLLRYLESTDDVYPTVRKIESRYFTDLYRLFAQKDVTENFNDCFLSLEKTMVLDETFSNDAKTVCAVAVPNDLVFGLFGEDIRYERLKVGAFYSAYRTKDAGKCETLLQTQFSKNKKEDIPAIQLTHYLICTTLAETPSYDGKIQKSEAIRRATFRLRNAVGTNRCSLYADLKIQSLCNAYQKSLLPPPSSSET